MATTVLDRTKATLAGFERLEIRINGVKTIVYSAGTGAPVVYLHGAGTFTGFSFAQRWVQSHRVIIPYHPGFGESDDDRNIEIMQDYALHYLDLFDALKIHRLSLVGASLGGWMAAEIAITQQARLDKLVLAAPAGLVASDTPATDAFTVHPRDLLGHLVADPATLAPFLPAGHDLEFLTLRYRETTATARLTWERPAGDPRLARWIHRIRTPTLLVWGAQDRMRPIGQAKDWLNNLPNARLLTVEQAGHLPLDEKPDCADRVLEFLDGNDHSIDLGSA